MKYTASDVYQAVYAKVIVSMAGKIRLPILESIRPEVGILLSPQPWADVFRRGIVDTTEELSRCSTHNLL